MQGTTQGLFTATPVYFLEFRVVATNCDTWTVMACNFT